MGKPFTSNTYHTECETMMTKTDAQTIVARPALTTPEEVAAFHGFSRTEVAFRVGMWAAIHNDAGTSYRDLEALLLAEARKACEEMGVDPAKARASYSYKTLNNHASLYRSVKAYAAENKCSTSESLAAVANARAKVRTEARKTEAPEKAPEEKAPEKAPEEVTTEGPDPKALADLLTRLASWVAEHADEGDDEALALVIAADEVVAKLV
jgi:hypothetical protein